LPERRARTTLAWACVALLLLVGVAAWQVGVIPESAIRMSVGPSLVPGVVVGMLGLAAATYAVSAWRGRQPMDADAEPGSLARVISLLGGGIVFMAGVQWLGFILPAALCGMGVARAFDAPFGWRSAAVCGAVATVFWLVFARLLGVGLGPALPAFF
jgi:hypothetical protein